MPTVLITGAARGIGRATAMTLSRSGWRTVLVDAAGTVAGSAGAPEPATADDLDSAVAGCTGADSLGIAADVRDADSVRAAVERAKDEFGSVDAAVAAAGRIAGARAWETDDETWDEMFAVNFHGVRHLAEAVIPGFLEGGGRKSFVGVSSASALTGLERLGAYGAAKSAVVGYVRALAADLRGTGVTANVICPGSTDTPMLVASAGIYGLDGPQDFAEHQLLNRLLRPEEVANAISFLCGPGGSGITGAVIPVDGGMTT